MKQLRGSLWLLALSSCEIIAGLTGDRRTRPHAEPSALCDSSADCGGLAGAAGATEIRGGAAAVEGGAAGATGGGTPDAGAGGTIDTEPACPSIVARSCDPAPCDAESPCTTLVVPGGEFMMGRSGSGTDAYFGAANELPEHRVTVSRYWLDKYEVSVGRFRRFVEVYDGQKPARGAGAHPGIPASGWKTEWNDQLPDDREALVATLIARNECNANFRTWTPAAGSSEDLPMNCIDWYLSFAFCIWDGGRLPTEAEWEFAAAGGSENRLFPWGSEAPTSDLAVFACVTSGSRDCSPADIRPIGSKPAGNGRFGQADLAGSMLERTRDVMDPDFYDLSEASELDPISLGQDVTLPDGSARGGSYISDGGAVRAASRTLLYRYRHADGVGFRCARDP